MLGVSSFSVIEGQKVTTSKAAQEPDMAPVTERETNFFTLGFLNFTFKVFILCVTFGTHPNDPN